jgi:hypothetical protein
MLKMKPALVSFLLHLASTDGRKEFNQEKFHTITEEGWIFIEGLCNILTTFKNATSLLRGDRYQTFTQALPTLRKLKSFLIDGAEGNLLLTCSTCKPIAAYMKKYESDEYFPLVVHNLKACCSVLLEQFK